MTVGSTPLGQPDEASPGHDPLPAEASGVEAPGPTADAPVPPVSVTDGTVPDEAAEASSGRLRLGASAGDHRAWPWRMLNRGDEARAQEDTATPPPVIVRPQSLVRHSPFSFGFFATMGGIIAFGLARVVVDLTSIILLVVVALFLALGLNPLVEWLSRHGLRRGIGVALVTVGGIGVLVLGGSAVLPIMTEQTAQLYSTLAATVQDLRGNTRIAELDRQYHFIERINGFLTSGELVNVVFGGLLGAGRYVANAVFSVIVTLVLTIYFLASLESIKNIIYRLSPASKRERTRYIAEEMFRRIGAYLTGMFIVVTIASACAFVFMVIAGLGRFALALAFIVAMFAFIPLIGSSMSMIVVALFGFTVSPTVGIAAIVYFLIYQQFDAYVIQPRVMSKQVSVPGAVVVIGALAGGTLLGIVGALIAVPTAAALLLLYREVVLPNLDAR